MRGKTTAISRSNTRFKSKRIAIAVAALAVVTVLSIVAWHEISLNNLQADFIEKLEQSAGIYNEDTVVLYSTTKKEAQKLSDMLGGHLRITPSGSFATVKLPEGMTLRDVAENREYREYLGGIALDYNNVSVSDISDEDIGTGVRANYEVGDDLYPQQTYLDYINVGDSWNRSLGKYSDGTKVKIAVIDTGIDTDHPEFFDADGKSIISENSYDSTNDKTVKMNGMSVIEDKHGHGTAVAGVIAAQMNGAGIAGIAPDVELVVIKCECDNAGNFMSSADIIFAVYYAIEQDVDVINMSEVSTGIDLAMYDALQLAVDSDIIPVVAAGNDATGTKTFPAAFNITIGVGALAPDSWELADYSNYGDNSDLVAPGTTLTAEIGGGYTYHNGTSMASPVVSAAAAIYVANNRYVTFEDFKADLLASCKDLGTPGEDRFFGFGALDMNALICEEKGTITYDYCTEEFENTTQVFVRKHTIQTVPEPERDKHWRIGFCFLISQQDHAFGKFNRNFQIGICRFKARLDPYSGQSTNDF